MKRLWWMIFGGVLGIGIIILIVLIVAPKSVIPNEIKKQVTSTLLVPGGSGVAVNRDSAKYDSADKLLTFNTTYAGTNLVISEQPTPEQFVDIPAVYTKLTDGLNNYLSFDTSIGTIHLTEPKELSGKQAAVLNASGTLMFVKPEKNLTDDQWRIFFKGMTSSS